MNRAWWNPSSDVEMIRSAMNRLPAHLLAEPATAHHHPGIPINVVMVMLDGSGDVRSPQRKSRRSKLWKSIR